MKCFMMKIKYIATYKLAHFGGLYIKDIVMYKLAEFRKKLEQSNNYHTVMMLDDKPFKSRWIDSHPVSNDHESKREVVVRDVTSQKDVSRIVDVVMLDCLVFQIIDDGVVDNYYAIKRFADSKISATILINSIERKKHELKVTVKPIRDMMNRINEMYGKPR